MKRTLLCATICSALFVFGSGTDTRGQAAPGTAKSATTISIDNFTFKAQTVTVSRGTTVTWVNHDDVPHKIVTTDKKVTSPVLDTDGQFAYTFTTPGTYEYYCSIHPMMTGTVIVK